MKTKSKKEVKKVALAYSGGLDTSIIVPWLKENYHCEVICFCADVGQGEDLSVLDEKAKKSGADQLIIRDFARRIRQRIPDAVIARWRCL